jgi:hypothetical protein
MRKKSNYTDRRQHHRSKIQRIIDGDFKCKDYVKNERIEWLEQLYAEWLAKRSTIVNKETYLINEPDELDTEYYLKGFTSPCDSLKKSR